MIGSLSVDWNSPKWQTLSNKIISTVGYDLIELRMNRELEFTDQNLKDHSIRQTIPSET